MDISTEMRRNPPLLEHGIVAMRRLWLPQLQELQTQSEREGVMFLAGLGFWGLPPFISVEPLAAMI